MKKGVLLGMVALVAVVGLLSLRFASAEETEGTGIWEFVSNLKRDLNYYAQVINSLRDDLDEMNGRLDQLSLVVGAQNLTGAPGAGNIAFIYKDGTGIHALKTDGTVWKWPASGWVPEGTAGINVPIPTANILEWQLTAFLDKNGDLWRWNNGVWTNFGQP